MALSRCIVMLIGLGLGLGLDLQRALAQPGQAEPPQTVPTDPALALREANAAAAQGDWIRVRSFTGPLLARQLDRADLAEAHRLAGIAAYFAEPSDLTGAETHFLEFLRIDLDGQLDPALYPPEVITFFSDVRSRHSAELRARRPKGWKRTAVVALLPPFAQWQNGDRTKAYIVGGLLVTFLATNLTTYALLRSWCSPSDLTCDAEKDRTSTASTVRQLNITAGVGLIITYVYGVYDGVSGYRRRSRERALAPYATSTNNGMSFGVRMNF